MFILRNLIEKAIEWQIHLFVFDGNAHKAYDFTTHASIVQALDKRGVSRVLAAAWLWEIRRARCAFALDADTMSLPVSRTRSVFQGDPSTPAIFNATLDEAAGKFKWLTPLPPTLMAVNPRSKKSRVLNPGCYTEVKALIAP